MAARRLRALEDTAGCPDAMLVRAASDSDEAALAELYRRHAPAAERTARSVAANTDDASDAVAEAFTRVFGALTSGRVGTLDFRAYLLAATRNAAIDQLRRSGRVGPSGDLVALDQAETRRGPSDQLLADEDSALIARAFRDLPERWQSVLWLTEVERISLGEAAGVLGLSANNVSQLALRARARLRERYLQALVHNHAAPRCQPTVDRLGAYVAGTLTARRRSEVDAHLAGCPECRRRQADVDDLGASLRRTALPVPAVLGLLTHVRGGEEGAGPPAPDGDARPQTGTSAAGAPPRPAPAVPTAAEQTTGVAASPLTNAATSLAGSPAVQALATNAVATMAPVAAAGPVQQWAAAAVAALVAILPMAGGTGDPGPALPGPQAQPAVTAAAPPAVPATPPSTTPPPPPPAPPTESRATAAPPPPPVARPARATAHPHSSVAEAVAGSVSVHGSPGTGASFALSNPQPSGAPLVFLVLEQQGEWLHVLLPTRPNGSHGWVRAEEVSVSEHSYSIVIELGAHQITVFDGNQVILNELIGVGTANTPTPGGLYYIKELIEPIDASGRLNPGGPYGPYAYGLSGFSDVLDRFGGGDGVIGIHGTNDPSTLGHDVSHGCIRMSNAGITALAGILPLGVPVEIRA